MVKVKTSKDKEREKDKVKDDKVKDDKAKERTRERERDGHKDKDRKDKEHKDLKEKANGKPAKELFKSPFSSDDLAKWRQLLLSRRSEISNDIDGLVKDAMEAEDGHTTPNHIAE